MEKEKITKNLAYSAILLKKGKHLSGHCGGGQRKQAPCDGLLISFSTAEHEKNAESVAFQDAVFLPLSLIPGMEGEFTSMEEACNIFRDCLPLDIGMVKRSLLAFAKPVAKHKGKKGKQ